MYSTGERAHAVAINPQVPCDLVIDHSLYVDASACDEAHDTNCRKEFERNRERYAFLKRGRHALKRFRVVPPGIGIVHQVNLEALATTCRPGRLERADFRAEHRGPRSVAENGFFVRGRVLRDRGFPVDDCPLNTWRGCC